MIVCTRCGQHNEPQETFCASCGEFLEWYGEKLPEPAPAPAPEPAPKPEPELEPGHEVLSGSTTRPGSERQRPWEPGSQDEPETGQQIDSAPVGVESEQAPAAAARGDGHQAAWAPGPLLSQPHGAHSRRRSGALHHVSEGPGDEAPTAELQRVARIDAAEGQPLAVVPKQPRPAAVIAEPVQPSAQQPSAVKPGRAQHRARASVSKSSGGHRLQPGDVICGQCGEGNRPERRFCRRCGASLLEAEVVQLSRWQRVKAWFRRHRRRFAAGERRHRGGGAGERARRGAARTVGLVLALLVSLALIGLIVAAAIPVDNPIHNGAKSAANWVVRQVHPNYEPVRPDSATATSAARPAGNAIDGLSNTSWAAADPADDGVGQVLTLRYKQPADLDEVGFIIGASEDPKDYGAQPRPAKVRLTFSDGTSTYVTLKDQPDFQSFDVSARATTSVAIRIVKVYPGTAGHQVAIAEVDTRQLQEPFPAKTETSTAK